MASREASLDRVFRALSNPTRRAVVRRLGRRTFAVRELAAPFDMALSSFLQHLHVLERSGLVRTRKVGRVRRVRLVPKTLEHAAGWLTRQRLLRERRLDPRDAHLGTRDGK